MPAKRAGVYEACFADVEAFVVSYAAAVQAFKDGRVPSGEGYTSDFDPFHAVEGAFALARRRDESVVGVGGEGGGEGEGEGIGEGEGAGEGEVEGGGEGKRTAAAPVGVGPRHEQVESALRCLYLILDGDSRLPRTPETKAGRCVVESALADCWRQYLGVSLPELVADRPMLSDIMPFHSETAPRTFVTVGITTDPEEEVAAIRSALALSPLLKVKAGTDVAHTRRTLRAAAVAGPALLCVDANAVWTYDMAVALLPDLVQARVSIVEQPFPVVRHGRVVYTGAAAHGDEGGHAAAALPRMEDSAWNQWVEFKAQCTEAGIRVYADESVCEPEDVIELAPLVHGCNVKLEKSGGLRAALVVMMTAHRERLDTWVGTMVGSSLAMSFAASLLRLSTYAYGDVDSMMLVTEASDVYRGTPGTVMLARTGSGQLLFSD